jgi:hypothetical protein
VSGVFGNIFQEIFVARIFFSYFGLLANSIFNELVFCMEVQILLCVTENQEKYRYLRHIAPLIVVPRWQFCNSIFKT